MYETIIILSVADIRETLGGIYRLSTLHVLGLPGSLGGGRGTVAKGPPPLKAYISERFKFGGLVLLSWVIGLHIFDVEQTG